MRNSRKPAETAHSPYKGHAVLYPGSSQMVLCPETRKISYRNRRDAEAAALAGRSSSSIRLRGPSSKRYKVQAPYDCEHCDYWHLTTNIGLVARDDEREVWTRLMKSVRHLVAQMRKESDDVSDLAEALLSLECCARDFRMRGHPNADEGLASPRRNITQIAVAYAGDRTIETACEIAAEALHDRYFDSDEWHWVTAARERLVGTIAEVCSGEASIVALLECEQAYLSSLREYMSKEFTEAVLLMVVEEEFERVLMATEECIEACDDAEILAAVNEVLFGIEEFSL